MKCDVEWKILKDSSLATYEYLAFQAESQEYRNAKLDVERWIYATNEGSSFEGLAIWGITVWQFDRSTRWSELTSSLSRLFHPTVRLTVVMLPIISSDNLRDHRCKPAFVKQRFQWPFHFLSTLFHSSNNHDGRKPTVFKERFEWPWLSPRRSRQTVRVTIENSKSSSQKVQVPCTLLRRPRWGRLWRIFQWMFYNSENKCVIPYRSFASWFVCLHGELKCSDIDPDPTGTRYDPRRREKTKKFAINPVLDMAFQLISEEVNAECENKRQRVIKELCQYCKY